DRRQEPAVVANFGSQVRRVRQVPGPTGTTGDRNLLSLADLGFRCDRCGAPFHGAGEWTRRLAPVVPERLPGPRATGGARRIATARSAGARVAAGRRLDTRRPRG